MSLNQSVLQFMQDGNRPYGLNDIHDKLGKDHGKTALQKALDGLVAQGKLFEKSYGKQKIYCVVQKNETTDAEKTHQELRQYNEVAIKLEQKVKEKQNELKQIEQELKRNGLTKSASQLREENEALKTELKEINAKIQAAEDRAKEKKLAPKVDPNEIKEVDKEYEKYLALYKKRKALCMEMIDAAMESYPGSKKKLMTDIGIETDEDVGFTLNSVY